MAAGLLHICSAVQPEMSGKKYDPNATVALCTMQYVVVILWPLVMLGGGLALSPTWTLAGLLVAAGGWAVFISLDGAEYRTGRPDKTFTQTNWLFQRMREYLSLTMHCTEAVQAKLLQLKPTGQAIFTFFPHGVNSDFRVLMDGPMYDAFAGTYEKASGRACHQRTNANGWPARHPRSQASSYMRAPRFFTSPCRHAGRVDPLQDPGRAPALARDGVRRRRPQDGQPLPQGRPQPVALPGRARRADRDHLRS
jgi:hypothetical protein